MPEYNQSFGYQFWFISTIIQLYFLFIPMCMLKDKLKNKTIFMSVFFIISVIWWITCYILGMSDIRIWNSFCLQYVWEFALGFIIAEELYNGKTFKINNFTLFVTSIAGIGLYSAMVLSSRVLKLFNDVPALIGYTSLALLLMNIPIIEWLGKKLSVFSYEFFLVHVMIFSIVHHLLMPASHWEQCFVALISMIIALTVGFIYNSILKKYFY